jgi:tape measure domain-containing protein
MAKKIEELIVELNADVSGLQSKLKLATTEVEGFSKKSQGAVGRFRSTMGAAGRAVFSFQGALAAAGLVGFTKNIIDAQIELQRMEARMLGAVGSTEVAAEALRFASSEADRLGLRVQDVTNGFAQFSAAALRTGLNFGEVKDIFSAVSEAARSMQLSAADNSLVFQALSQIASKGVVSMEELRQQLGERMPIALGAAAKGLGVTTQELNKMVESGTLLSQDFLPAFARGLREETTPVADTFQNSLNRLNNAFFGLRTAIGGGEFMSPFNRAVQELTKIMENPALIGGLKDFALFLGQIAEAAVKATSAVVSFTTGLSGLIKGGTTNILEALGLADPSVQLAEKFNTEERQKLVEEIQRQRDTIQADLAALQEEQVGAGLEIGAGGGGAFDDFTLGNKIEKITEEQQILIDLEKEANKKRLKEKLDFERKVSQFQQAGAMQRVGIIGKEIQSMIGTAASGNKSLFQLQKVAAIAQATLQARESVISAYNFGTRIGGPPVGAAFAGVAAAAQAANIAQLASTSFGGGGGVSGGGGGGAGAIPQQQTNEAGGPIGGSFESQRQQVVNINLGDSEIFSRQFIRETLLPAINDAVGDGAKLVVQN